MKNQRTINLVKCAVMSAVMCILAQISFPIGTIPFTLGIAGVYLVCGLLDKYYGVLSVGVYILIGAVGLPVFSGFKGGLGALFGPTGGYIIGYIFAAVIICFVLDKFGNNIITTSISFSLGLLMIYVFGTAWFVTISGDNSISAAIAACITPFVVPDIIKVVLCVVVVRLLRPALEKIKKST